MKTIYLIGGTMGVGKTTVCQQLKLKEIIIDKVKLTRCYCLSELFSLPLG